MSKKTRLIFSSDSWAWCWYPTVTGSWPFSSKRHLELSKGIGWETAFPIVEVIYKAYGYDLTVVGKPGGNNFEQIKGIAHCEVPADAVLFMQTDPFRDITSRGISADPPQRDDGYLYREKDGAIFLGVPGWSVDYFEQKVTDMLHEIYTELCRVVTEKHPGCKLVVVGGNSSVNTDMLTQIADQFGCDLHILSYCLLDELELLSKTDIVNYQFYYENNIPDRRPVHPCFLFRLAVDNTWNKELLKHLQRITLSEWDGTFQQYLEDHINIMSYDVSDNYKQLSFEKFHLACWPDTGHINAGAHIWLAEQLNQYLESRGL